MANLIRVKQLDQPDLSGFFNTAFINTGIFDAKFVDKFTDQNISGVKTFIDGVNLNNIDNLSLSGVDISITSGNIALTNRPTVNGTGVVLNGELNNTGILLNNRINSLSGLFTGYTGTATFASNIQLANTGSDLFNRINSLSGTLTGNYSTITNLANTGSTLVNRINSLSGTLTGNYSTITNLANTGSTLVNRIDSLSGTLTGNYGTITNLASTGSNLFNRINSLSGSAVLITGNQNISGVKTFFDSGIFSLSGALPLLLQNNPLSVVGSGNAYLQLNIQNRATGLFASADLVITANNGTDSANFINLGINNVGYNDPAFTNGTGLDGYLFIDGGNLDIGTKTPGRAIEFHAGGTISGSTIARISESGLNVVSGNLTVNNTGVLLSGQNSFILPFSHTTETVLANTTYYFSNLAYTPRTDTGQAKLVALDNFVARKASWTSLVSTFTPATISTGYFYNLTKNTSGIISDVIRVPLKDTIYNYGGILNPPIAVNINDEVAIALKTGPSLNNQGHSGFRNSVNVYCYN